MKWKTLIANAKSSDYRGLDWILQDTRQARVIALAPELDQTARALGALAGGLPSLLSHDVCHTPLLHAAIRSLVGGRSSDYILSSWSSAAPAGWGAANADVLLPAMRAGRAWREDVVALIGPASANIVMFDDASIQAFVIHQWGRMTPDNPTEWTEFVGSRWMNEALDALSNYPGQAARCLPWLPRPFAASIVERLDDEDISRALLAYIVASDAARKAHAAIIDRLIQYASVESAGALTRVALSLNRVDAWEKVYRLVVTIRRQEAIDHIAKQIICAATWETIPENIQHAILRWGETSDVCAAIAYARGALVEVHPSKRTACAFFGAISPRRWAKIDEQKSWLDALGFIPEAHIAIRSLGPEPAILEKLWITDEVCTAAKAAFPDDDDGLRAVLLPLAVKALI